MGMIERVATILMAELSKDDEETWGDYKELAETVIEAMREPTFEMKHAVINQWGRKTWGHYNDVIDAALKTSPTRDNGNG